MDEKKHLNSAGFYAVLGLLLAVIGLGGWALMQTRPEPEPPAPAVTDPVRQPKVRPAAPTVTQPPARPVPKPAVKPAAAPAPLPQAPEAEEPPALIVYPVDGQIQAAFSADDLQYSPTLDDWRTHDGIDLAADSGTTVLAACAGTVKAVETDPLMGVTVTLTHPGGLETCYANLKEQPPVLAGDEVAAGQIIGAVGETAEAEQSQPPHLHFSVMQDGRPTDPEAFLNP